MSLSDDESNKNIEKEKLIRKKFIFPNIIDKKNHDSHKKSIPMNPYIGLSCSCCPLRFASFIQFMRHKLVKEFPDNEILLNDSFIGYEGHYEKEGYFVGDAYYTENLKVIEIKEKYASHEKESLNDKNLQIIQNITEENFTEETFTQENNPKTKNLSDDIQLLDDSKNTNQFKDSEITLLSENNYFLEDPKIKFDIQSKKRRIAKILIKRRKI